MFIQDNTSSVDYILRRTLSTFIIKIGVEPFGRTISYSILKTNLLMLSSASVSTSILTYPATVDFLQDFLKTNLKQAWAELCQAQYSLS